MADVLAVKKNVSKMIDAGATDQQIDAYLSQQGVTAADLRAGSAQTPQTNPPPEPNATAPQATAPGRDFFLHPPPLPEQLPAAQALPQASPGPPDPRTYEGSATKKLLDFAVPMALPTIGAGIGTLGGVPGIAAGSLAGEAANQALGITPKSNLQLALAAGLPLVPSVLKRGGAFMARFMTPGGGAETLNRLAGPEVENFISRLAPAGGADPLFAQATQEGGSISMTGTLNKLDGVIREMESASTPPAVLTNAKNLWMKIASKDGFFNPTDLQQELEIFGKTVSKLERTEGSPFGIGKQIYGALLSDLDNAIASGSPGAATLKLARDTFKRSTAIEGAVDISNNALKPLRGQGDAVSFNAAEVIRKLQGDKFFGQAFSASEQKEIFNLLTNLNKIPALKPGAGQNVGSYRMMQKIFSGTIGGGMGAQVGGATGGVIGTAVGLAIPPAQEVMRNIWIALNMKEGRALMKQLLAGKSGLTEQGAAALSAFVRANIGRPDAAPPEATGPPPLPAPDPSMLPMAGVAP